MNDLITSGQALQQQGQHAEALPLFERAVRLSPTNALAWFSLGDTLNTLKRFEDALAAYDQATALAPDDSAAWNHKGRLLAQLKAL